MRRSISNKSDLAVGALLLKIIISKNDCVVKHFVPVCTLSFGHEYVYNADFNWMRRYVIYP